MKILPAIRAELARVMIQENGLFQQDIAVRLGVTNAAVSQYVNLKRGYGIDLSDDIKEAIRKLADSLLHEEDPSQRMDDFCTFCRNLRNMRRLNLVSPSELKVKSCICPEK